MIPVVFLGAEGDRDLSALERPKGASLFAFLPSGLEVARRLGYQRTQPRDLPPEHLYFLLKLRPLSSKRIPLRELAAVMVVPALARLVAPEPSLLLLLVVEVTVPWRTRRGAKSQRRGP